jgi:hypothetical protein
MSVYTISSSAKPYQHCFTSLHYFCLFSPSHATNKQLGCTLNRASASHRFKIPMDAICKPLFEFKTRPVGHTWVVNNLDSCFRGAWFYSSPRGDSQKKSSSAARLYVLANSATAPEYKALLLPSKPSIICDSQSSLHSLITNLVDTTSSR